MAPLAKLDSLPPELYSAIFVQVEPDDLQSSVLALSRAIPRSPVPIYHLFEHVRLKRPHSVFSLYRRIRGDTDTAALIKNFSLETWTVDADVVLNLVSLLPKLRGLKLFIGPSFSPEHLEELFDKPQENLQYISLRFRP